MSKDEMILQRNRALNTFEDRPLEVSLSAALVFFGVRALFTNMSAAPGSVQELPVELAILYCVLSAVGGLAVIFGMFSKWKIDWAYGIERAGLYISSAAWASYTIGLFFSPINGKSTLVIFALIALSVGYVVRATKIKKDEDAKLDVLRSVQAERNAE